MFNEAVSRMLASIRLSTWDKLPGTGRLADKDGFGRRVILLAGGTALGQGISIVSAPLLTRLYTPADFGLLAVYGSIFSAVLGVASLRYHLAIPVASDKVTVANLLVLSLLIVSAMTLLFGISLWFVGDALVAWVQTPALKSYLWILPLSFLGAGTYQVLNSWAIRNNYFGPLARTRWSQGLSLVATQVGLGLLRLRPVGLLIGDAVGRTVGSLSLARLALRDHHDVRHGLSFRRMLQAASRYRRFPLLSGPSALLMSVQVQVPTLLLASFYGGMVVGWFGLGSRLLTVTFFLVASSVGDVYLNESATLARENPARLMPLYWQTLRRAAIIMVPLLGTMAIVAPFVFGPVFGSEWTEAGHYVRILAILALFDSLSRSVGNTLSVVERQDLALISDVLGISLTTGSIIAGGSLGLSPIMTIILFAIGGSLASIIYVVLAWYALRQAITT